MGTTRRSCRRSTSSPMVFQHAYVVGFGEAIGDQRVFHVSSRDEGAEPGPSTAATRLRSWGWIRVRPGRCRVRFCPPATASGRCTCGRIPPRCAKPRLSTAPPRPPLRDPGPRIRILSCRVGEIGDWDSRALDFPAVVRDADGYLMLYGAVGGEHPNEARIGLAHSADRYHVAEGRAGDRAQRVRRE